MAIECDVAVIGGGPAAATLGTLLRKYNPELKIALFEREIFPRDHVGESQIPHLMSILDEMEVWEKVEAADFPIKIGGLYKWGSTDDLWALDFLAISQFKDEPRPAKYQGQRRATAFQVDRSIYDKILLDHAKEAGCHVYEGVKVASIGKEGDRITGFEVAATEPVGEAALGGETQVKARWYIDASGNSGLLRRAMGVEIDSPTALRNIAVYDYWQNSDWAERIGVGGTRILTLSIACGWLWFIPIGTTRTSIGLVVPAEYVKKSGKKPEELYAEAVANEPTISRLVAKATRENITQATKDWSFVSERLYGENWFLAGDSAGFADPILSAGLTLAHTGARNLAFTIMELDREGSDAAWLKECYERTQTARIRNHIRFADYWYSTNGHFSELKEYCSEIARNSGVKVAPEQAFVWMGSGGFASDNLGFPGSGTFTIRAVKFNILWITGKWPKWEVENYNKFRLNLEGAAKETTATYTKGRVHKIECYKRGQVTLPNYLAYGAMIAALNSVSELDLLIDRFVFESRKIGFREDYESLAISALEILEAMLVEGWLDGEVVEGGRFAGFYPVPGTNTFRSGWVKKGVGLTAIDPRGAGKIIVDQDKLALALA